MPLKVTSRNAKTVTANLQGYGSRVEERGQSVIQESADRAYSMAYSLCAVLTGETRSKMRKEVGRLEYAVGFWFADFPDGPVPLFLEFGTNDTPSRPCIIPTRKAEHPRLRAGIKKAMAPR